MNLIKSQTVDITLSTSLGNDLTYKDYINQLPDWIKRESQRMENEQKFCHVPSFIYISIHTHTQPRAGTHEWTSFRAALEKSAAGRRKKKKEILRVRRADFIYKIYLY